MSSDLPEKGKSSLSMYFGSKAEEVKKYFDDKEERQIKALYGACVATLQVLWVLCYEYFMAEKLQLVHLLWAMHFLRVYPTEDEAAAFFRTTRKTYRFRVWQVLNILFERIQTVIIQ
jgi:hypothetical protein